MAHFFLKKICCYLHVGCVAVKKLETAILPSLNGECSLDQLLPKPNQGKHFY